MPAGRLRWKMQKVSVRKLEAIDEAMESLTKEQIAEPDTHDFMLFLKR